MDACSLALVGIAVRFFSKKINRRDKMIYPQSQQSLFCKMHVNPVITFMLLVSLLFIPNLATANSAKYFYDRAGRLSHVVEPESGEIYHYDKLGNLLSVQQESTSPLAPLIAAMTPDIIFVGGRYLVEITGENFLSTESVTSANPVLTVSVVSISDTEIIAEMTASSNGVATVIVSNEYGQASIDMNISSSTLTMTPERLTLTPGESGIISVEISPPLDRELLVNLYNNNPQIATFPDMVSIPISGIGSFTVNALEIGTTDVTVGNDQCRIIITENHSGEYANLASQSVSVRINTPESAIAQAVSNLLSVLIEGSAENLTFPAFSKGVSVRVEPPRNVSSKVVSKVVSVRIESPQNISTKTVSNLVSVSLQ